jgi:hypothetical protein
MLNLIDMGAAEIRHVNWRNILITLRIAFWRLAGVNDRD